MLMSAAHLDRAKLLDLALKHPSQDSSFWQSPQPTLWLPAHNQVTDPGNYYKAVAELHSLTYQGDIPVKMNDTGSLAASVGAERLSRYWFFPFKDKQGHLVVACAEPFYIEEIRAICAETLDGSGNVSFVVTPLSIIQTALTQSLYQETTSRAESSLNFAMPEYSSKGIVSRWFRFNFLVTSLLFIGLLLWQPPLGLLVFFVAINIVYVVLNPLRLLIVLGGLRFKPKTATEQQLASVEDNSLPIYTVLVPTKGEAAVVPQLMANLRAIDYPADKLDIKLITEVDDLSTIEAFEKEGIDDRNIADENHTSFQLIKVPVGELSTKPRSCNYALQFARGQLTVIYDAEDQPDPLQLRKAYFVLTEERLNTLCVQAKLNFYNVKQNLLTRFFSLEYGFWYDFLLPGLEKWHIPLPLGGTSNHFITGTLKSIGTWDPYNVTEDADLGWRLSKLGYRTTMLDSYTLEEANSQVWNWIKQRTRWQKGFLLTTMVHLRHPILLVKRLGVYGAVSSAVLFTTNFLLPLVNPILWVFFLLWYVPQFFGNPGIGLTLPDWLRTVGLINLVLGNGIFMLVHLIAALGKKQWSQIPLVPLMPLYWLLISLASYRSVYQILVNPYSWEKTKHGLHQA